MQVVDSLLVAGCLLAPAGPLTSNNPQPTTHLRPLFLARLPATVILTSVAELEDRWRGCPRWRPDFGRTPGSANKIKRTKSQRARLNLNPLSHEPPRSRE